MEQIKKKMKYIENKKKAFSQKFFLLLLLLLLTLLIVVFGFVKKFRAALLTQKIEHLFDSTLCGPLFAIQNFYQIGFFTVYRLLWFLVLFHRDTAINE